MSPKGRPPSASDHLNVTLPRVLKRQAIVAAAEDDMGPSEIVIAALTAYLSQRGGGGKGGR